VALNENQRAFLKPDLVSKDNVIDPATGAPLNWASLGGAFNLSYLGTTSVGGTVDTPGSNGYGAAKKITVPSNGLIHAIGVYVTQQSGADSFGPAVAIMADNAGAPGKVIAYGASQRVDVDTQGGRFIDVPCISQVVSGAVIWLAARIADTGGSVLAQLAYAAGGTDRIATWGAGVWAENTTYTTTTRDYSIRALFQS
jgi:hypothetical protein